MERINFYIYGDNLPPKGAWYNAPLNNQGRISPKHIRHAYIHAQQHHPRPKHTSMYKNRWTSTGYPPITVEVTKIENVWD